MSIGSHQSANSKTDTWLTPPDLTARLGYFDLDPCPAPDPKPFETATEYCQDGLKEDWFGRVWMNPPYGNKLEVWLRKMSEHNVGMALIFARTETKAFQEYVFPKASGILFFNGRLHFWKPNGTRARGNAGAPSVLISYGMEDLYKLKTLSDLGKVVKL